MIKSICRVADQMVTIPSWEETPIKCYRRFIPTKDNRYSSSFKLKYSPYKTPKRTVKAFVYRSNSVVSDINSTQKPTIKEFPKRRNLSTSQNVPTRISRSRSITKDKISLYEIESIERLQQLIPPKPVFSGFQIKASTQSVNTRTSFLVSGRPALRTYKKFVKTIK